MKKVASVSRPKKLERGSRTGRRETEETFNSHQNIFFFLLCPLSHLRIFRPSFACLPGLRSDCREAARTTRAAATVFIRSEEHTSELPSRQYLVCRLLLEK